MSGRESLGMRSGSYGSLLEKQILQQFQQQQQQNGFGGAGISGSPLLSIQTTSRIKPGKMNKEKERVFLWIFKLAFRKKVGMLLLFLFSAAVFGRILYVGKGEETRENQRVPSINIGGNLSINFIHNKTFIFEEYQHINSPPPPPPALPQYFLGYTLPSGHPCNSFSLPPPPADRKRIGPRPCPVCYLPVEEAIALMPKFQSYSPVIKNLTYIHEDPVKKDGEFGGSDFGGYPTLSQRSDSFDIRESMSVHCGFVRGEKPGQNTGFDVDEVDRVAMEQCDGVVVASAIFGAFDIIQQPSNISEYSKRTVCFFMFVDEETESYLKNNSGLDDNKKIGIWRIVVVHNIPYADEAPWEGICGERMQLLQYRHITGVLMCLWKLKQIKLQGSMIMAPSTFRLLFIERRV